MAPVIDFTNHFTSIFSGSLAVKQQDVVPLISGEEQARTIPKLVRQVVGERRPRLNEIVTILRNHFIVRQAFVDTLRNGVPLTVVNLHEPVTNFHRADVIQPILALGTRKVLNLNV